MVPKIVSPKTEIANLAPNYQDGTISIYIGGLKLNYCCSRPMGKKPPCKRNSDNMALLLHGASEITRFA